jgi:hypothetical protein
VYRFYGDVRAGHTPKNGKFPVVGPRPTTGTADCVYNDAGNVIEAQ